VQITFFPKEICKRELFSLKPYFSDKTAPIPSPKMFVMCTSLHIREIILAAQVLA